MDEKKIIELAMEYGLKCDPLNQKLEKQADIRQGFIEGMNQALNLFSVSGSACPYCKETNYIFRTAATDTYYKEWKECQECLIVFDKMEVVK